jgi:hypothetical protein
LEKRRKILENHCRDLRQKGHRDAISNSINNVYFMKQKLLIWCPVFKAGSTTWFNNMVDMADIPKESKVFLVKDHSRHIQGHLEAKSV